MTFPYTFRITGRAFTDLTRDDMPSQTEAADLCATVATAVEQALAQSDALGFDFTIEVEHGATARERDTRSSGPQYQYLSPSQVDALAEAADRKVLTYSTSLRTYQELVELGLMTRSGALQAVTVEWKPTPLGLACLEARGIFLTSICQHCDQVIRLQDNHWMDIQERVCFDMNPHQPTSVDPNMHAQEG